MSFKCIKELKDDGLMYFQDFGFFASRDDTTITVTQDYDRLSIQRRVEEPLVGDVKIIAISDCEHGQSVS